MKAKLKWKEQPNAWHLELNGEPIAEICQDCSSKYFVHFLDTSPALKFKLLEDAKDFVMKAFGLK